MLVQPFQSTLLINLSQKDHHRVREAIDTSLSKLKVDYVDLYLMHWPMAYDESGARVVILVDHSAQTEVAGKTLQPEESPTVIETWKEMEKLVAEGACNDTLRESLVTDMATSPGKARAIGVSNFSIKTLSALLAEANIIPAVNQVELHPSLPQHDLLDFCRLRGIVLTAYSPVGKFKFANDPVIQAIAQAQQASGAQVLLSWGVQRGTAVIPKSAHVDRMQENLQVR